MEQRIEYLERTVIKLLNYIKYGIYCEECDDRSCSECIKKVFRNEINADWTTNNSFNVNIKGGYETLYFTYADSKFTFICHTMCDYNEKPYEYNTEKQIMNMKDTIEYIKSLS